MTIDLDTLDLVESHDLWSDIVERSQQAPALRLQAASPSERAPLRWRQLAGGLTAAACVTAVLFVARDRAPADGQATSPDSVPAVDARVVALPRLAALALPRTVPGGWQLVELMTAPMLPNAEITQPAGQLYRRTSDGAAIRLMITPTDPATADSTVNVERPYVVFEAGAATYFQEAGADVSVQTAGVSTDDATQFVRQLSASGSAADLRFSSNTEGWVLESSIAFEPATPDRQPFGVVTYRSDDGEIATFRLTNADLTDQTWRLGVPTDIDGVTIYRVDSAASRQLGPLLIWAQFAHTDPTDAEVALLTSFDLVDSAAWSEAADQLAVTYSALPATGRLEIDNVTITLHTSDDDLVLCAIGNNMTRCVPDPTGSYATGGSMLEGDLNLDGTWVHVGLIDVAALQGITATTDSGPARADWTTTATNGVVIAAIAPPDATTMTINAQETPTTYWGGDGVRPVQ